MTAGSMFFLRGFRVPSRLWRSGLSSWRKATKAWQREPGRARSSIVVALQVEVAELAKECPSHFKSRQNMHSQGSIEVVVCHLGCHGVTEN